MKSAFALLSLLAACDGNIIGDPPPITAPCSSTDAPSRWMIGTASGASPLTVTLSLQTFAISGLELADFFAVDNGQLANTQFDAASLASASAVTLTINPMPDPATGAPPATVTIHTGATCSGKAKAIDAVVDLQSESVEIDAH